MSRQAVTCPKCGEEIQDEGVHPLALKRRDAAQVAKLDAVKRQVGGALLGVVGIFKLATTEPLPDGGIDLTGIGIWVAVAALGWGLASWGDIRKFFGRGS